MYDDRKRIGAEYLASWLLNKNRLSTRKEVEISLIKHFGDLVQEEADKRGVLVKILNSDIQIQALLDNYSDYFVKVGGKCIGYNKDTFSIPNIIGQLDYQVYVAFLAASVKLDKERDII